MTYTLLYNFEGSLVIHICVADDWRVFEQAGINAKAQDTKQQDQFPSMTLTANRKCRSWVEAMLPSR